MELSRCDIYNMKITVKDHSQEKTLKTKHDQP